MKRYLRAILSCPRSIYRWSTRSRTSLVVMVAAAAVIGSSLFFGGKYAMR
jgi:hypothetical protein